MTALIAAVLVLSVGAGACVLPLRNVARAGIGIASQVLATGLVWVTVVPVLSGGPPHPLTFVRGVLDLLGIAS